MKTLRLAGLALVFAALATGCTNDELKVCLDAGYSIEYCQNGGDGGTAGGSGIPGDTQQ